jgi:uncharacterized protein YjhX (UPF0386 family)
MKRKNSLQDYEKLGQHLQNIDFELFEYLETSKMLVTSKEYRIYRRLKEKLSELKSEMDATVCRDYPNFEYRTKVFYNRGSRPMDYQEKMEKESQKDK